MRWTHNICQDCWAELHPDRQPHKLVAAAHEDICCFCGRVSIGGIYVREDPTSGMLLCRGDCDAFKQGKQP
jgi:hypothetical protein